MRLILIVFFSAFCLSASAQWYRLDLKFKKHVRPDSIAMTENHSVSRLPRITYTAPTKVTAPAFGRTEYSFQAAESLVMHSAQHNMRYRVYTDASYDFSALARLYIQQNRFSEAKWYLLQSNSISREQNDDRHTIHNLIDLATSKAGLGDYTQAQQDLDEARLIANIKSLKEELAAIDKQLLLLKQNKLNPQKIEFRYAEVPAVTSKAE